MDNNFLNQFAKKDAKEESNLKTNKRDDETKTKSVLEEKPNPNREIKPAIGSQSSGLGSNFNSRTQQKSKKFDVDALSKKTKNSKNNQKIVTTEHIVEKDESYQKRKMIRYGVIGGSVFIGSLFIFLLVRLLNQVEIKDFVGNSIAEARTWALTNHITIEEDEVFDIEYDENLIIEQSVDANGKLQKGSVLKLIVSKGPDPDEIIELPDFESMTTNEINKWRQENRANNVNVREEYSDEIEEGQFIKKEFGRNVDEDAYLRRDGLVIFMSKGKEVLEANISVPDFKDKPKTEVEKWAKDNEIDLTIEDRTSSTVQVDDVISQSIDPGEKLAKRDEMTVVVSLGKSITVPNFSHYTSEDASSVAPELNIFVQRRYSSTVPFGRLISQSVSAGKELIVGEDMSQITVVYSEGQPYMENLINESEHRIPEYFHDFTSRGANITYTINYVDSYEPKGNIVWMSKHSQFLSMTDHININISRGNLTPPVDIPESEEDISDDE